MAVIALVDHSATVITFAERFSATFLCLLSRTAFASATYTCICTHAHHTLKHMHLRTQVTTTCAPQPPAQFAPHILLCACAIVSHNSRRNPSMWSALISSTLGWEYTVWFSARRFGARGFSARRFGARVFSARVFSARGLRAETRDAQVRREKQRTA